jgi:hypothetical protein
MRYFLLFAFAAVTGCGASGLERIGPALGDEDLAYRLVWEGAYGMERESRPPTQWIPDCLNPAPRAECVIADLDPDGSLSVSWMDSRLGSPRIGNTPWPEMLGSWRTYLLTGKRGDADADLTKAARIALAQAGL